MIWGAVFLAVLAWSGVAPFDYVTWALEVAPAVIGAIVLLLTRRTFPLTPLVYILVLVHCIILMVGGHYTYAKVPAFDWLRDAFDMTRKQLRQARPFCTRLRSGNGRPRNRGAKSGVQKRSVAKFFRRLFLPGFLRFL